MPSRSAPSNLSKSQRGIPLVHCGAKTRAGTPCKKVAGFGTDHVGYGHCKLHGGSSHGGAIHASRLEAAALALEYQVEPHEALLRAVGQAAKWELICRTKVAELDDDKLTVDHLKVTQAATTTVERTNVVELNVWVKAHRQAIRELASIAKTAIDAGVDERRVRVAETLGDDLATLIGAILTRLDLSAAQQAEAPAIVRTQLALLEGGATG